MERTEEDSYLTLAEPAEALYKEKGSKFLLCFFFGKC